MYKNSFDEAVLKTLIYADVFDYCLKEDEIWQRLIWNRKSLLIPSRIQLKRSLDKLGKKGIIARNRIYYFLKNREETVKKRLQREIISHEKFKSAHTTCLFLKIVPFIKLVMVTGTVAAGNAKENDDIDLLIVTNKNRLWLSRFLTTLFFEIVGRRRRPNEKSIKDKFCLNMFLDDGFLNLPQSEQSLYTAYELLLAKPLWDRDDTYLKFIKKNLWVRNYLLNISRGLPFGVRKRHEKNAKPQGLINHFEELFYRLQIFYMQKKRTKEIVERLRIKFHPEDAKVQILQKFHQKLVRYRITAD